MEYKVGSKVKIKNFKRSDIGKWFGGFPLLGGMYDLRNFKSEIVCIMPITGNYIIKNCGYIWPEEMFDPYRFKFGR